MVFTARDDYKVRMHISYEPCNPLAELHVSFEEIDLIAAVEFIWIYCAGVATVV